jgi:hypothetical protein
MRTLPIDSSALGTPEEFPAFMEDKVRDTPLCLCSRDLVEEGIAEKTARKVFFFIPCDISFLNKLLQLKGRVVFRNPDEPILWPFGNEFPVSSQDHTALRTSPLNQVVEIFSLGIDRIIAQQPQAFR